MLVVFLLLVNDRAIGEAVNGANGAVSSHRFPIFDHGGTA